MKKLLVVMLTLVLAFTAFGCGESYTEVPQEDYAQTMTEFMGEEETLTTAITNDVRIWAKMEQGSEGSFTTEMIFKGSGDNLELFTEVKTSYLEDGETVNIEIGAYVKDGYIYSSSPNPMDPDNDIKIKVPYTSVAAEMMDLQNAVDAINEALEQVTFDPSDAEFMASIGKMEISGKAGSDRKIRLTISENDTENGTNISGTITIAFDKDNKVTGVDMKVTTTVTEEGETETMVMEIKIEKWTKAINFPSFSDYTVED